MPDANGKFKGISVPASAWERVFGRTCTQAGGCDSCPDAAYCATLRVNYGVTTQDDEDVNRDKSPRTR